MVDFPFAAFFLTFFDFATRAWPSTLPKFFVARRSSLVAKPVDKGLYGNYLRKAEEMPDVAQYAVGASESRESEIHIR